MTRNWLIAGSISAMVLVAACGKKDDDKPASSGSANQPTKGEPPTTASKDPGQTSLKSSPAASDLGMLPGDAELVLGASVAQLVQTQVWKQLLGPMVMQDEVAEKLAELKSKCGIDPMASMKSVTVGAKGLGADRPEGVVVVHGLDKAKVMPCMDKVQAEVKGKAEITRDGEVTIIKPARGGDAVAFTFTAETTAVVVFGPNATAAGVKAATAGTSSLGKAPAFVELFNAVETGDTVWLVMNGSSKAFDPVRSLGVKPKALYGSVKIADGFTTDLRFRMPNADEASKLAGIATKQVAPLVGILPIDKFDVTQDGADVKAVVAVSGAKLPELIEAVQQMMGGEMSMGMGAR